MRVRQLRNRGSWPHVSSPLPFNQHSQLIAYMIANSHSGRLATSLQIQWGASARPFQHTFKSTCFSALQTELSARKHMRRKFLQVHMEAKMALRRRRPSLYFSAQGSAQG